MSVWSEIEARGLNGAHYLKPAATILLADLAAAGTTINDLTAEHPMVAAAVEKAAKAHGVDVLTPFEQTLAFVKELQADLSSPMASVAPAAS